MKKTFQELALRVENLQEDQQGRLQGGFASFSVSTDSNLMVGDNGCTNNCPCLNGVSGCGATVNTTISCR